MVLVVFIGLLNANPTLADGAPFKQKYHVQINPDFHLFQYDIIGNTHVLIYVQKAYNADGDPIGWAVQQVAGPWGNSVEYIKDQDNINKAYMVEFKEALNISMQLEFLLAGILESSYWTGEHIIITGDPVLLEPTE